MKSATVLSSVTRQHASPVCASSAVAGKFQVAVQVNSTRHRQQTALSRGVGSDLAKEFIRHDAKFLHARHSTAGSTLNFKLASNYSLTLGTLPSSSSAFSSSSAGSSSNSSSTGAPAVTPRPKLPPQVIKKPKPKRAAATPEAPSAAEESADVDADLASPPLSSQALSLLYTYTTPPPLSSLSALANRLALSVSNPDQHSLADHLPLLEQCLVHESFWQAVDTQNLPGSSYTHHLDSNRLHNGPLATLGNALLGTLASELLLASYPRLPTRVGKAALTMYVGPKSLAAVASSWGIGPTRLDLSEVGKVQEARMSRKERAYGHLVGGVGGARKKDSHERDGAAGAGLVRWNRQPTSPAKDAVLFEDALASVARAVVGAIHQVHGFAAARSFVHGHFLPRLITSPNNSASPRLLAPTLATQDLVPLLKFTNPSRVLSLTVKREHPTARGVVHRLLKESGRLSSHATYVSGVYLDSGAGQRGAQVANTKLGEGFGSSIKMSEWRASEDALRRWYLARPPTAGSSSGLPSDAWVGTVDFKGMAIAETEVHEESRS